MQEVPMETLSAVMLKKGRGRKCLLRPWNERLIVLSPTQQSISYYIPTENSNQDQAPVEGLKKGELSLIDSHVKVIPFCESGKPFTFELTTADGQLTLSASSACQRDEWMCRIAAIVASRNRVSSTTRHVNGICSLARAQKKSLDRKALVLDFPDGSPSSLTLSSTTRGSTCSDIWTISDLSEESCFADMPSLKESFVPSLQLSHRRAQEQQLLRELAAETNAVHAEENAVEVTAMKKLEKYRQLAAHEASLVREWQYWGIKNDLTEACDSLLSPRSPRIISPRASPRLDSPRSY